MTACSLRVTLEADGAAEVRSLPFTSPKAALRQLQDQRRFYQTGRIFLISSLQAIKHQLLDCGTASDPVPPVNAFAPCDLKVIWTYWTKITLTAFDLLHVTFTIIHNFYCLGKNQWSDFCSDEPKEHTTGKTDKVINQVKQNTG